MKKADQGHPTVKAVIGPTHPTHFEFSRPEIQDETAGALAQVDQPTECNKDAWHKFAAMVAYAMGDSAFSNVFVAEFPWKNAHQHLQKIKPELRRAFLCWFFSGAFPKVGLRVGETLANWMIRGVYPTVADLAKIRPTDRIRLAMDHVTQYGQIIQKVAQVEVPGGVLLRGGVKINKDWGTTLLIQDRADWTEDNKAMAKLLKSLRSGTWEYAWSVVRQLVELIVADDLIVVAGQIKDWSLRRVLQNVTLETKETRQSLEDVLRESHQEGVLIGRMTHVMEEYTRWAAQGYLGVLMADALRDQDQEPESLPNPALHLVEVCKLDYWPVGRLGYSFYLHDLAA